MKDDDFFCDHEMSRPNFDATSGPTLDREMSRATLDHKMSRPALVQSQAA